MLLINRTPLHAALVPNANDSDGIVSLFVVAATFDIGKAHLRFSVEQRPLLLAPEAPLIGDGYLTKAGTSVCATGFVHAAGGSAVRADATLFVGDEQRTVAAIGPRTWREIAGGGLVPSPAQRFDRIAMTWENAYGGMTEEPARIVKMDGEEVFVPAHEGGYAFNLNGKGFYTDAARAVDRPLPQLEDPEHPIRRWDDRPEPVCFAPYPMWGGMRAEHVFKDGNLDMAGAKKLPNRGAPRSTFDAIEPGTPVALLGMRPGGGLLSFDVPAPPVAVDLWIGGRADRLLFAIDSVDIDAEASEVRFVYRTKVTYDLVQFELRQATLTPAETFPVA